VHDCSLAIRVRRTRRGAARSDRGGRRVCRPAAERSGNTRRSDGMQRGCERHRARCQASHVLFFYAFFFYRWCGTELAAWLVSPTRPAAVRVSACVTSSDGTAAATALHDPCSASCIESVDSECLGLCFVFRHFLTFYLFSFHNLCCIQRRLLMTRCSVRFDTTRHRNHPHHTLCTLHTRHTPASHFSHYQT
jgi:hypothetical protein